MAKKNESREPSLSEQKKAQLDLAEDKKTRRPKLKDNYGARKADQILGDGGADKAVDLGDDSSDRKIPRRPGGQTAPAPTPVAAVPDNFAPNARRSRTRGDGSVEPIAPARVTRAERRQTAQEAGSRTGAPTSTDRVGPAFTGRSRRSDRRAGTMARNARYRAGLIPGQQNTDNPMGPTEGAQEVARKVNARRLNKEREQVSKRRNKIVASRTEAAVRQGTDPEAAQSAAIVDAAMTIRPRGLDELGRTNPVLTKGTPEYHAQAIASSIGIPVDHLHHFLTHKLGQSHPQLAGMTRPEVLKGLYNINSKGRKKDISRGRITADQGRDTFAKIAASAKDHSRMLTDIELQKAEKKNGATETKVRSTQARAGQNIIGAHVDAADAMSTTEGVVTKTQSKKKFDEVD